MTDKWRDWWRARTPREQLLLRIMAVLLFLVLGWLLVVRPLADTLDSAKRRHAEAVTALAQARARADADRPIERPATSGPPRPVDVLIAQSAAAAGFGGARIAAQGPRRATVGIEAARPQAFFGWVRRIERSGIAVESLRARANDDRTLTVEAAFRARSG